MYDAREVNPINGAIGLTGCLGDLDKKYEKANLHVEIENGQLVFAQFNSGIKKFNQLAAIELLEKYFV